MSIDECSIQQLVAQLRITHFQSYLLNHGWVETPSRYADQLRYEGNMNDGEGVYEMYLPVSSDVAKYRTRLLRNIYKLCGIEDREPREIAREMVVRHEAVESREATRDVARLRVLNAGSKPLHVRIDLPTREHTLYEHEAIELTCRGAMYEILEIEQSENGLAIRTLPRK